MAFAPDTARPGWRDLGASFQAHARLIALILLYAALGTALVSIDRFPGMRSPWVYMRLYFVNAEFLLRAGIGLGGALLIFYLLHLVLEGQSHSPLWQAIAVLRDVASRDRVVLAAPILLVTPIFLSAFTTLKSAIPWLHPFDWDATIAELGWKLHGGHNLWQLLQPVFGYPPITRALDFVYVAWFVLLYGILFWQIFSTGDQRLRMQFLWSFLLCWIVLGTVCATVFSSVGPCYYELVTGVPGRFGAMMDYLRTVDREQPLMAVMAQDYLWQGYVHRGLGLFDGISAMPSMHVSMATLFALLGAHVSWRCGVLLSVFALLTFVASVELGWHYGLDGYAAALGTMLIWFASGWCLRRAARRDARTAFAAAD